MEVECHLYNIIIYTILKNVYGEFYEYKVSIVIMTIILTQYDYYDCYDYMSIITAIIMMI